jgi:hypothetical protein
MSWLEKTKTKMIIQTGDGVQFTPNWMNAKVSIEYNISEFNFPNVKGTLVDRREMKGSKFDLELYFQGEDHLDVMKDFVRSAEDRRPWIISHPFYDLLYVQPQNLNIDNTKYNVSKITTTVIQTLLPYYPVGIVIPEDKIEEEVEHINEATSEIYANEITPGSEDKNAMLASVVEIESIVSPKIEIDEEGQEFFNDVNDSKSKIANATDEPGLTIDAIQKVISAPALLTQDLTSRLGMLTGSITAVTNNLLNTYTTLVNFPNSIKKLFETMIGSILNAMALAMSKPVNDDDYANRVQVTNAIEILLNSYNQFISDLDSMQTGTGGNPQDYIPNSDTITDLNNLVNFTMSNLFEIGFEAKQERTVILEDDSDFVTLAHRFYGLIADDVTIDELIRNNDLGLNGILNIKKGTPITYYI